MTSKLGIAIPRFNLKAFDLHSLGLQALPQFRQVFAKRSAGCLRLGDNSRLDFALIDPHLYSYRSHLSRCQAKSHRSTIGTKMLKRFADALDQFHA
jgi:hypothetical protein